MRQAAKRLKDVVAKKDLVPLLTHFIAYDGMLFASNGQLTAATPCPVKQDFIVRAADFYRFIDRVDGDIKLTPTDTGHVKVSCGRFRATFPGLKDDPGARFEAPKGKVIPVTSTFIEKLWAIRAFLSDNATQKWATCALVRGNTIVGTNNVVVARAENAGVPKDLELMIGFDVIDFLASRPQGIKSLVVDAKGAAHFMWEDGSWLKGYATALHFPDVSPIFDNLPDPDWEIPDKWKEAYEHLAELSDGEVQFFADKIITHDTVGATFEVEEQTPIDEERDHMSFLFKFLSPVIKDATHAWFFTGRGPQISFRTPHIVGTIIGTGR